MGVEGLIIRKIDQTKTKLIKFLTFTKPSYIIRMSKGQDFYLIRVTFSDDFLKIQLVIRESPSIDRYWIKIFVFPINWYRTSMILPKHFHNIRLTNCLT